MPIAPLPIFTYFNKQRFIQAGSMDAANFYAVSVPDSKNSQMLYPAMGREHISVMGVNKLIFTTEPRGLFKSIDFVYVVVNAQVYQVDKQFNTINIGEVNETNDIWFAYLPVGDIVVCMFTDGVNIFILDESSLVPTLLTVTDPNRPMNPRFVAAMANRFEVSVGDSSFWYITTQIPDPINLATLFTVPPGGPLFASASGKVRQMVVFHNTLYIFTDFTCDIWSNIPTQISVAGAVRDFPFKLNSSYNWDYGMADPFSLAVDYGRMVWLAQNESGLVSFMMSHGEPPQDISTQAINILLEDEDENGTLNPFLTEQVDGFLYQWENTIFYRVSAGKFFDFGDLDIQDSASSLEYNFATKTWARVIELNGERNRIRKHKYLSFTHLVTVQADPALYSMAGNIYRNEIRNPAQPDTQAPDAFIKLPMRYELVTQQIFAPDYSEFKTNYVEIDFVFGDRTFYKTESPFQNVVYIVDETSTPDNPVFLLSEDGKFIIQEGTNFPTINDDHYNALFKPHIELYYSDDGGITFKSADLRPFSPLGEYRWRMRTYELGVSRNRVYKLICVSSAPIVILGGVMDIVRVSGGAN